MTAIGGLHRRAWFAACDWFRRWVFGFDAALFIGGMQRATYVLNPGVAY